MRTLFGLFGSLLLLACLGTSAEADRMRQHNGDRSSMFAPRFHQFSGPMIGHDRPFIPRHVLRGQAFTRKLTIVSPGPVPPLTGTTVPPFSVGGTVHTSIVGSGGRLVIRKHRFAFGTFPAHDRGHRLHRFHGGFPAEPFFLFGELNFPDHAEILGGMGEEGAVTPVPEATSPSAPVQSIAGPAAPTWRSGRSVLTGTLEEPQIIFVSPARESRQVRIFAPSDERAPTPQIAEVPAQ